VAEAAPAAPAAPSPLGRRDTDQPGARAERSGRRDNDKLVVKGGAMPNVVMDDKGVKALATLPSREELLAKLMATMQAPIGQFVRTLNEVPARLVRTVAAVRDAKEKAEA
jgi:large subunit ribosomal protein L10